MCFSNLNIGVLKIILWGFSDNGYVHLMGDGKRLGEC